MVAIDASMLLLFLRPETPGPRSESGGLVQQPQERVEYLISELDKSRTKIVIPTPALSEVLIRMGTQEAQRIVETLNRKAVFSLEPFDQRAAIELAAMLGSELSNRELRLGMKDGPDTWAKLKFDRQIIAIAKVCGVDIIYSDDGGIHTVAGRVGIDAQRVSDLPFPPDQEQTNLLNDLEEPGDADDDDGG